MQRAWTSTVLHAGASTSKASSLRHNARLNHFFSSSRAFHQSRANPTPIRLLSRSSIPQSACPKHPVPRFLSTSSLLRAARPQWYQDRPIQTIRSSPLKRVQFWIDRKIPRQWLLYGIIAANGLVFAAWVYAEDVARRFRDFGPLSFMYKNFAASWVNILRPWTLLTSCFSQKDFSHIFANLFTFYFMAPAALAILTTSQAAGLYLVAGLAGNAVQLIANMVQRDARVPTFAVGASGAINGFLAFVGMAFPKSTILLFAIVPVPAWVAVSGLVCYDMYVALRHPNGGIAAAAHLGGAGAGVLYYLRLARLRRLGF